MLRMLRSDYTSACAPVERKLAYMVLPDLIVHRDLRTLHSRDTYIHPGHMSLQPSFSGRGQLTPLKTGQISLLCK
jgi:hypothetical protein